jgi:hypothetical protein
MISHAAQLACRREVLIARSAAQRMILAEQGQALAERLLVVDIALTLLAGVKKNPAWIAGLVLTFFVIRPPRLWSVLRTGLFIWQALLPLVPLLKGMVGPPQPLRED